jgi:hypothetical protein
MTPWLLLPPTAHPLVALLKTTEYRFIEVGLVTVVHELPLHMAIVPPSPTAQAFSICRSFATSVELFTIHTALRLLEVGLVTLLMFEVCAKATAGKAVDSDNMHSAKAILVENFI